MIKTIVLAALMAVPFFAKAQTFAGITAEKNAQNTPAGWTAVNLPQLPAITSANTFNIKDYGASTSAADNTKAIQKALDAVPSTGGMVVIPAGTWMFGSTDQMTSKTEVLSIKAKTILHLCAGATLKLVEYGKAPNTKTVFIGGKNKGKNVTDIVIEGEGETSVIDGQGARWWLARENGETFNPGAMIRFEQGKRFLLRKAGIEAAASLKRCPANRSDLIARPFGIPLGERRYIVGGKLLANPLLQPLEHFIASRPRSGRSFISRRPHTIEKRHGSTPSRRARLKEKSPREGASDSSDEANEPAASPTTSPISSLTLCAKALREETKS